ncbi:hypothetical protein [Streptomyces sp. NPDC058726]|uniref:hypothetical protein n=1 Tax=Streptomyces sp. NPDC058726 TaxID=3346611 RepID=UPI0036A91D4D
MAAVVVGIMAVIASLVAPILQEVFKKTRMNDALAHIGGIHAYAEEVILPACPSGYCHLKYVIRNNSSNAITKAAIIQPGRDKLNIVHLISPGGALHEEIDPQLRQVSVGFTTYPVAFLFTDSLGRTWHKRTFGAPERVKAKLTHPESIDDFEKYRNPDGWARVLKRAAAALVAVAVLASGAYLYQRADEQSAGKGGSTGKTLEKSKEDGAR